MFSIEYNGYDKEEVENYISNLKAGYEKLLMEEKLKVLEAEKKVLEYKNKQKNIMSVLESFKKAEAEGNRNLEILRGEQLRMIYHNLLTFLEDLNNRYPGVLINKSYKSILADIESILGKLDSRNDTGATGSENDPMRILLSKIQDKKTQEPKEVKIERAQLDRPSMIKPVCESELKDSNASSENYDNLVDKFLNSKPIEEPSSKSLKIQSNGFDIKEAVNPKDDLSEIMKAFDFFNDENNKANPNDYHFND